MNAIVLRALVSVTMASPYLSESALAKTQYNAVKEFSIKSNPAGFWSYLDSAGFLQYPIKKIGGTPHVNAWYNEGSVPYSVVILSNKSGGPISLNGGAVTVPTDHLLLDGENDSAGAVVRFTAPTAGVYHIVGDFEGLNQIEHSHPVAVIANGTTVFSATIAAYGQPSPFKLKLILAAGEDVDFVSQSNGSGYYLGTGLAAKIQGP